VVKDHGGRGLHGSAPGVGLSEAKESDEQRGLPSTRAPDHLGSYTCDRVIH
jgi:hypothetical protein